MAKAKYKKNSRGEYTTLIWDGTYNKDGTKHRKKVTSRKSSADLERKVAELKAAVAGNGSSNHSDVSFYRYAVEWLEISKASKEENTKAMYRNIIETHLSRLDGIRLSDFTHSHFQQVINSQLDHPRTCQQIHITVKQIVKSAVRDRILPRNALDDICTDISLPKYKKPEKRPLRALEIDAMKKADLDPRKRAFISILYYCGLRRGEALALKPGDFDWDRNVLNISKSIIFDKNKGTPSLKDYPKSDNGIRSVPIFDDWIDAIKPYVMSCTDSFLFHGRNNEMMTLTAFIRMWQSIILSMNVALGYNPNAKKDRMEKPITDLTPHVFRHNFCTMLCYQVPKISTKMIARLLGDDEKMVLEVYSHIVEEKETVTDAIKDAFRR